MRKRYIAIKLPRQVPDHQGLLTDTAVMVGSVRSPNARKVSFTDRHVLGKTVTYTAKGGRLIDIDRAAANCAKWVTEEYPGAKVDVFTHEVDTH